MGSLLLSKVPKEIFEALIELINDPNPTKLKQLIIPELITSP